MNVVLGGQESAVITHTLGRLSDMMRQSVRTYVRTAPTVPTVRLTL